VSHLINSETVVVVALWLNESNKNGRESTVRSQAQSEAKRFFDARLNGEDAPHRCRDNETKV
jgi:hypothetical protein